MRKADFTFTDRIYINKINKWRKYHYFSEPQTHLKQFISVCFTSLSPGGSVCGAYLVPDVLCGVHDVSEERVDCCVGYQDIYAPALIQSLVQTRNESINELYESLTTS